MKKTILTLSVAALLTGALFTNCTSSTEKVADAENKVIEANKDLEKANQALLTEIETFRAEKAEKIATNEKSIADFKARIETDKKAAKEDYKIKIAELEQKNSDMKRKMDEYKADGKEGWEKFKSEFSTDMDNLTIALASFLTPSTK